MKTMLIVNPLSRRTVGERGVRRIEKKLRDGGLVVETRTVSRSGDARRLAARARDESCDLVVCAGGDGTINEAVNSIAGSEVRLGILPMGTGNVLAWELGIPLNPFNACRILTRGRAKRIDLCKANETYFTCMAGVGFDAQVVRELAPQFKELLGPAAYPLSGLRTLLHYDLPELEVEIDGSGEKIRCYALIICNSRRYGGRFKVCPDAVIDDGVMDIMLLHKRNINELFRFCVSVLIDQPASCSGVICRRAAAALVRSGKSVPVHSDGDIVGTTPVSFTIAPGTLLVMAPDGK